jgi:hypothetical protein
MRLKPSLKRVEGEEAASEETGEASADAEVNLSEDAR